MQALGPKEILRAWEQSHDQRPVSQALSLLAAAVPDASWEQLAAIPLGRRDAMLLALHQSTFGPTMEGLAVCQTCGERVEFTVSVEELLDAEPVALAGSPQDPADNEIAIEGFGVRFHLPTSADLTQIETCTSTEDGRNTLLQLCVLEARREGRVVPTSELPESVVSAVASRMMELDPLAEITLNVTCPECTQCWSVALAVAPFVLAECANEARGILHGVHLMARAYAWPESEILAMSDQRRRHYLEMVS